MKINSITDGKCFGCMACYNTCQKDAISIITNDKNFYRPHIDESLCINCGICTKVCPTCGPDPISKVKKAYAAWNKSKELRKTCTSGGAFAALACTVIDNNGIVYGVGFENGVVKHKRAETKDQLLEFYGSKYVQSFVGDAFKNVKKDLEENKSVLFSGSPCQIDGLKMYLSMDYNNLITCDVVCHGVPSPRVYRDYISWIESKYGSNAESVRFRDKRRSWKCFNMKITFSNGQTYLGNCFTDPFHVGFLKNIFLQDSCYSCKYSTIDRVSDITMADFWDYFRRKFDPFDTDKGISLILANTEKGDTFINAAVKYMKLFEKDFFKIQATQPALNRPFNAAENEKEFWIDYSTGNFDEVVEKYMHSENTDNYYTDLYKYGFWRLQIRKIISRFIK